MFKPKVINVDMMQKKTRHLFKIPLIVSLGIALAIMIHQAAYGTGQFYESYYTFAPYSKAANYGTHAGTTGCFDCHYGHGDDKTRTEFLTTAGAGVDACSGASCHTNAGNIIGKTVSPVEPIYNSTNSPYQGITAYESSAHNTVSNMFWPGAASTISAYLQVSSSVTSAEGACFNCHNPHGQPDPDSGATPTKPFLCKAVAGIDVCFVTDNGQTVNGITGNNAGGVDPDTAENLCYACHGALGTGTPKPTNYDYSRTVATIQAQFGRTSHHPVKDSEQSSNATDPATAWKVECNVCHNPHICQKSTKVSSSESPISPVTDNTILWGDGAGEKMSDYLDTGEIYQNPSGEPAAANLTDFNTFCLGCHGVEKDYTGLSHDPINWGADKHGKGAADIAINMVSPYDNANFGNYVLSCTDCHEPHGASNLMLTRTSVNGGAVSVTSETTWKSLCERCHTESGGGGICKNIHHDASDAPYKGSYSNECNNCHGSGTSTIPCTNCHFHGGDDTWVVDKVSPDPYTGRGTF